MNTINVINFSATKGSKSLFEEETFSAIHNGRKRGGNKGSLWELDNSALMELSAESVSSGNLTSFDINANSFEVDISFCEQKNVT